MEPGGAGTLQTEDSGSLKTEGAGRDAGWCGWLIPNHIQEVFFTVQFAEYFQWQRRRCESHTNLFAKQS